MERRIEQANGDGFAGHGFKNALEVGFLKRQELHDGLAARGFVVGENHFAHVADPVGFKEHVFGPA